MTFSFSLGSIDIFIGCYFHCSILPKALAAKNQLIEKTSLLFHDSFAKNNYSLIGANISLLAG